MMDNGAAHMHALLDSASIPAGELAVRITLFHKRLQLLRQLERHRWIACADEMPDEPVVLVMVTHPQGFDVGVAAWNGLLFEDMNKKAILGVARWARIMPPEFPA